MKAKLQPVRPEGEVVQDLDALVQKPSFVRLHGKTFTIKPMLVQEFFGMANALQGVKRLEMMESPQLDDIVDAYYSLLMPIVEDITKDDIRKCSAAQITALVSFVMDHVMGKAHADEKKKNLVPITMA